MRLVLQREQTTVPREGSSPHSDWPPPKPHTCAEKPYPPKASQCENPPVEFTFQGLRLHALNVWGDQVPSLGRELDPTQST